MADKQPILVETDGAANDHFYLTTLCIPLKTTYIGCKIKDIQEKHTLEGVEITIILTYREKK